MESPSEIVQNLTGSTNNDASQAVFALKSKSTINGAFCGGAGGLMIAHYSKKNLYFGTLIGAIIGGVISNILTVSK